MGNQLNRKETIWQQYWQILKHNKLPAGIVFLLTVILASIAAANTQEKYNISGAIEFSNIDLPSLENSSKDLSNSSESIELVESSLDLRIEDIKSERVISSVVEKVNSNLEGEEYLRNEDILKNLKLEKDSKLNRIQFFYVSTNIDRSTSIVNNLISSYIDREIANNKEQIGSVKEKLEQNLASTKNNLQKAESKLQSFKDKHILINFEADPIATASQIEKVRQEINTKKIKIKELTRKINAIRLRLGISDRSTLGIQKNNNSSLISQLEINLADVERRLAIERTRFQEQNPIIISLKNQKARLERELRNNGRSPINSYSKISSNINISSQIQQQLTTELINYESQQKIITTELDILEKSQKKYQQQIKKLPQLKQEYQQLKQEVESYKIANNQANSQLQDLAISENENIEKVKAVGDLVITQPPLSLNKKNILLGGIGLGSLLAVATAFLVENINPNYKSIERLRSKYKYKLLGSIDRQKSEETKGFNKNKKILPERFVIEEPLSTISQSYGEIYNNLIQINPQIKIITIVSPQNKEGKSTVSANLAAIASQLKKKVLIIDADFSHQDQHRIWQQPNNIGLREILKKEIEITQGIKQINPKIDLITSGSFPTESPSLLSDSTAILDLINSVRSQYDLILFDTPALSNSAVALKIAKLTDGIILIGRIGTTKPKKADKCKKMLAESNFNILGLVANFVTPN